MVTGPQPGDEVDAALVGRGDETAVLLDQLVLGAAVQEQSRQGGRILGAEQSEQVVGGSTQIRLAPDPLREGAVAQGEIHRKQVDGTGEAGGGREALRVVQGQLEGPEAAHRQACDEGVLAGGGDAEGAGEQLRQLFRDIGPVLLAESLVGVEGAPHLGHHHGDALRGGVALDRGAPFPDGAVIAQPVQEVQHGNPVCVGSARRIGPAWPVGPACPVGSLHADPGGCLRHQHHHGGAHVEGLGEEVGAHADHRDLLTGDGDG